MVDTACAVLQKNRIGIVTRSVQSALKHIYGIGGSSDTICNLLKEWRQDNLSSLKQGKNDKDVVSAILEATDDGLLDEQDIPEEYLVVMRQMAVAGYRLAYQKADTSVSGDRIKTLASENDLMRQQLKDFPQLQLELNFYKIDLLPSPTHSFLAWDSQTSLFGFLLLPERGERTCPPRVIPFRS